MGFITDIDVIHAKTKDGASVKSGYTKIDVDLNKGAGGEYIYLCYRMEDNPREAVDDIIILTGKNPRVPQGYTLRNVDLNKGAGGEYLYLCFRQKLAGDSSVCDISVIEGKNAEGKQDYVTIPIDLNKGAGGKYLWLTFRRKFSTSRWMNSCPDDKNVEELAIPGTHDTLTYSEGMDLDDKLLKTLATCQKQELNKQLEMGVRYFDIRTDDSLMARHGVVRFNKNMNSVFGDFQKFLKDNPSEAIFIRFKTEKKSGGDKARRYPAEIKRLLENYESIIWLRGTNTKLPLLKDVRGKIVIFDELGIDNGPYSQGMGFRYGDETYFKIQDDYNAPNEEKKLEKIKDFQKKCFLYKFKLNHVSATGTLAGALPGTWTPEDYAKYLNPRVCEELVACEDPLGIMIFDFIDSYIANRIYIQNFLL